MMRYAIVFEKAEGNFSAYAPGLPGCVATGATVPEVEQEMREAIRFHIDGLKEDGLPVPQPANRARLVHAFAAIDDKGVRRSLLGLAEGIARVASSPRLAKRGEGARTK